VVCGTPAAQPGRIAGAMASSSRIERESEVIGVVA
jgi:hypothetical protein